MDTKAYLILVLFVFCGLISRGQETKVTKPISPLNSEVPVVYQNNIKGGFHQVANTGERTALSANLKETGMIVVEQDTRKFYQWDGSAWRQVQVVRSWEDGTSFYTGDLFLYQHTLVIANSGGVIAPATNPLTDAVNWSSSSAGNLSSAHILVGNSDGVATAVAMSGDVSIDNTGQTSLVPNAVTYTKMQTVGSSRLLGNPGASSAVPSEISLGSGLSLSAGGELSVNVSGGTVGTVTEVSSSSPDQLSVLNGTTTPSLTLTTGNVAENGTSLATGGQIYNFVTGRAYELQSNKNIAGGYVGLDGTSKIDQNYLPSGINLGTTYTASSEAEQLALSGINTGDVVIRTDEYKTYVNTTGNNTAMSDWSAMQTPTGEVTSVNGKTGVVTLSLSEVLAIGANAGNRKITGLTDPTSGTDAATKQYVDATVAAGTPAATTTSTGLIQLSGDLSGIATSPQIVAGAVGTAELSGNSVTYEKMQQVASGRLLGNPLSTAAIPSAISVGSGLQLGTDGVLSVDATGGIVGTVTEVSSLSTGQLTITNGTSTPTLSVVTGAVADNGTALTTGNDVYDFVYGEGYELLSNKNTVDGYVGLGSDSKIDQLYLPGITLNSTYTASDEASQLALGGIQKGDVVIRIDENKTYINTTGSNTAMSDWTEMLTSTGGVSSVNGSTGSVIVDLSSVLGQGTNVGGQVLNNLGTPTAAADAATKQYVDDAISTEAPAASTTQTGLIQLAGDLTGTAASPQIASGAVSTTELADNAVTYTKMQPISSTRLLGNPTASSAVPSEISLGSGLSMTTDGVLSVSVTSVADGTSLNSTLYWDGTKWVASTDFINNNGDLTTIGDLTLNGGDLTTGSTSASLFNTMATTLNIGGAATTLNLGATSGTTTIANNLRIGTPSVDHITMDGGDLMVAGDAEIDGDIWVNDINTTSDKRLKTKIETLTGVLDKINQFRGVSFIYKDQDKYASGPQLGVIAQELQAVFPELVSEGADGYLGVNYSQLSAVVLQAVKEQQQEINSLKQRMDAQEQLIQKILKKIE